LFDHVTIRAEDRAASERFYETVLPTLGIEKTHEDERFAEWDDFSIAEAGPDRPPTRRVHIGFVAPSRTDVDEFWRAGTGAGYRDDGAPGPRPQYTASYYGAFLLDPDGNSAEAVHRDGMRSGGNVDHVWIRVADLAASKRFYETIGPPLGFRRVADEPERTRFSGGDGAFSVVAGRPSEHVHLAFPASDDAAVDAFHQTATQAGYQNGGAPGERPEYHPGYYAAYVLDPDGNNVEAVNHNRP
jgi:catechol 2,3-dioxygenase-like lactoylglutathione lyase family enzyme